MSMGFLFLLIYIVGFFISFIGVILWERKYRTFHNPDNFINISLFWPLCLLLVIILSPFFLVGFCTNKIVESHPNHPRQVEKNKMEKQSGELSMEGHEDV